MRAGILLTLFGGLALGGWLWARAAPAPIALVARAPAAMQGTAPSQRGTRVDGAARDDAGGALRIDMGLRRLFDYFLATYGERDMSTIRKALQQNLQHSLSAKALQQALALFDRYVAYRQALAGLKLSADSSVADRLDRIAAIRPRFFSPQEVQGLFGAEDAYDRFTVARLRIQTNPTLTAAEKQAELAQLESALPPDLLAARREPVIQLTLSEAEAKLRQQGGSEQDVYALRSRMVGQAAADRLSQLDREQAAWQQRIDGYLRQRQQILADPARAAEQKQQAISALETANFNAQERLRLGAYTP
ncbi:lipase secretion chaperone [Paludibacterium purpuratum]|uniref:Lipase chaperone n=1 Tax=Paludibacterium purpuratum TaxID=1144873 RepID=A0A4R7AZ06_9NEIS|nr:lipase secretion chaperone [Paludibacterium purpuratum]TDR73327.1 lipase chaperone LimK [Paludibacterium purpuratum]